MGTVHVDVSLDRAGPAAVAGYLFYTAVILRSGPTPQGRPILPGMVNRPQEPGPRVGNDQAGIAQAQARIAENRAEALRRHDYVSRVNLAYRECLANNVGQALELLDDCPEDLRGWEWSYVNRQCHLDLRHHPRRLTGGGSSQGMGMSIPST